MEEEEEEEEEEGMEPMDKEIVEKEWEMDMEEEEEEEEEELGVVVVRRRRRRRQWCQEEAFGKSRVEVLRGAY